MSMKKLEDIVTVLFIISIIILILLTVGGIL